MLYIFFFVTDFEDSTGSCGQPVLQHEVHHHGLWTKVCNLRTIKSAGQNNSEKFTSSGHCWTENFARRGDFTKRQRFTVHTLLTMYMFVFGVVLSSSPSF